MQLSEVGEGGGEYFKEVFDTLSVFSRQETKEEEKGCSRSWRISKYLFSPPKSFVH